MWVFKLAETKFDKLLAKNVHVQSFFLSFEMQLCRNLNISESWIYNSKLIKKSSAVLLSKENFLII